MAAAYAWMVGLWANALQNRLGCHRLEVENLPTREAARCQCRVMSSPAHIRMRRLRPTAFKALEPNETLQNRAATFSWRSKPSPKLGVTTSCTFTLAPASQATGAGYGPHVASSRCSRKASRVPGTRSVLHVPQLWTSEPFPTQLLVVVMQ